MRIDPVAAVQASLLGLLKGAPREGQAGAFAVSDSAVPSPTAPPPPASPPASSVAMLVAVAAQAPGLARPSAFRRAETGLAALGRLHRALQAGAPPADALAALQHWRDEGQGDTGELADLLGDIELRIMVELAKAERR